MNRTIDSIAAATLATHTKFATHGRKLIPALVLAMLWGCSSKTEEKPAQPAPQPQAAAPAEKPAPAAEAKPAEAPAPSAASEGEKVFMMTCTICHKAGVGGAPKLGDKADWEPRIKQGKDALYRHALEGFSGKAGTMPARGSNASLTDDQVVAAVDYMVDKAK